MRLTSVNTSGNKRKLPETGDASRVKTGFMGLFSTRHNGVTLADAVSNSWSHTHKLLMVRMCLLCVMVFVVCSAILEYTRLQINNAENQKLLNAYSQSVVTLAKRYGEINNLLANTNLTLATDGAAQSTAIQQLSSYAGNGSTREFTSYAELIAWLKQDDTHEHVYSPTFQCVDFAFMMSEHAIKDGYWIFPAVDLVDGHMQCIAPIGQELYAIEPQTNTVFLWAAKSDP
jgi:hypothetical protein